MSEKRIRKVADVRRKEILDAAAELFAEQGWDATTVQQVINRVGIAKGTFYHHFRSHEEMLDALLDRTAEQNLAAAMKRLKGPDWDAVTRLNRFFAQSIQWRIKNVTIINRMVQLLYHPENRVVRLRLWSRVRQLAAPVIADILAQGVKEGVMDIKDAEMNAELLLELGYLLGEDNAETLLMDIPPEEKLERMNRRYTAYTNAMAKMIGLTEGSIQLPGKQLFEAIIALENQ